jgi:predicted nucleic acid-binding protein
MPIVVSDTSPLRALAHLDLTLLLGLLFDRVLIPPAVSDELGRAGVRLNAPSEQLPGWLEVRSPSDSVRVAELRRELDIGESEAISLALEIGSTELLIDEHDGRQVARRFGLEPVGVIGVLIRAKARGHVPVVVPLLDRLQNELNFFISAALRSEAQRLAGE